MIDAYEATLEELGSAGNLWVDFTITFEAHSGEPMVMYDRNMTGYPGSRPAADLISVECTAIGRMDSVEPIATHKSHPDWLASIAGLIEQRLEDSWADWEQDILEELDERCCA